MRANLDAEMACCHFRSVVTPRKVGMHQPSTDVSSTNLSYGRGDDGVCPGHLLRHLSKGHHSRTFPVLLTPRSPVNSLLVVLLTNKTREFVMKKNDLPKQAVIYCRSVSQPQSRYDVVIARQEDACMSYADKHGIEVLEIFRDNCTAKPPGERTGFRTMCEYIRNINQPVMVLVQDYFSISRKPEEITEAFTMVRQSCGSEICDIPEIDEDLKLRRFKHEATVQQLLLDIMNFTQRTHEESGKIWDRICDVSEAGEDIQ